jgi:hypothetical protein
MAHVLFANVNHLSEFWEQVGRFLRREMYETRKQIKSYAKLVTVSLSRLAVIDMNLLCLLTVFIMGTI